MKNSYSRLKIYWERKATTTISSKSTGKSQLKLTKMTPIIRNKIYWTFQRSIHVVILLFVWLWAVNYRLLREYLELLTLFFTRVDAGEYIWALENKRGRGIQVATRFCWHDLIGWMDGSKLLNNYKTAIKQCAKNPHYLNFLIIQWAINKKK